jgi:peroxiredoxin family protein
MIDKKEKNKAIFVCAKDTLEGAYPSLVMGINAARTGMETRIFYTFMGVNMVLKEGAKKARYYPPGFVGAVPGMSFIASAIMKRKIKKANIPSLDDMMEMVRLEGVKLIACHMTVEMMRLDKDAFVDGVEIWTAEECIRYAKDCKICLFT